MAKLKEMRMMLEEEDPVVSYSVRKLAAVSLLEVFKDILPDYRIRNLSNEEKEVKVSGMQLHNSPYIFISLLLVCDYVWYLNVWL